MTMKKNLILAAALLMALAACGPKGGPDVIRWDDLQQVALPESGLPCFSSAEQILLDPEPNEYAMAYPEKVVLSGEKIYLMGGNGPNANAVVEYGHDGMPVRPIGKRGRGPGEYPRVTDFSVDGSGDCWLLDGSTLTVYHYNADGALVNKLRQPGLEKENPVVEEAVLFEKLANLPSGELLVGTALWDESEWKDFQTVICDTLIQVRKGQVEDPHTLDDNFAFDCKGICATGSGFQYLVPMEDKVHIFDRSGELLRSVMFDFGSKAVSDEFRKHVEPHFDELKDHTFLSSAAYVGGQWAMGALQASTTEGYTTFIADLHQGKWYSVFASLGYFYGVWDGRAVWLRDTDAGWVLTLGTLK